MSRVVDCHQHLWDPARFSYPWLASVPALNRSFSIDDYVAASRGTDIRKTVFVECDVAEGQAGDEARFVQELSAAYPLIAGIVAAARPEDAGFRGQVEALAGLPLVKGVRRVLHNVPDSVSQSALFAENLRWLGSQGLTFDLCLLSRQLPLAMALVRQCGNTRFVLDHCGLPDIAGGEVEPWKSCISKLAAMPNIVCKVSGLVTRARPDWSADDLRVCTDHVIAAFGFDRLLWGGDWPVCTLAASLSQWAAATADLLAGASDAERDKLLYANAHSVYRLA